MKDLKTLRLTRGITQKQLASKTELTETTINNIETHKTIPQSDVRKRIEIVFAEKIDWLSTCGLKPVREKSWESAEQELRKALLNVSGLEAEQQKSFLLMVNEYLKTLVSLMVEEKQEKEKINISNNENDVKKRRRTNNN